MVGYQFTGDVFRLPGVTDFYGRRMPLDVSLFTEEFMKSIASPIRDVKVEPPVVIPPVPPVSVVGNYVVTVGALNIRTGPGTTYAIAGKALLQHMVVAVSKIEGNWAKLVTGAWCYLPYLSRLP